MSALVLWIYTSLHVLPGTIHHYLIPISIVSLTGMLVESLPLKDIDNLTVTLAAVLVGHLIF